MKFAGVVSVSVVTSSSTRIVGSAVFLNDGDLVQIFQSRPKGWSDQPTDQPYDNEYVWSKVTIQ